MTSYDAKPWLALYDPDQPATITPDFTDALAMFRAARARAPDRPAIRYFDATITYAELDDLSDRLAAHLTTHGFAPGDRFAIFLQNVPQFVIAILAAWKSGGIAVAINPMNRTREIATLFADCTPKAVICHDDTYPTVFGPLDPTLRPTLVITTSALTFQTRNDPRLFATATPQTFPDTTDFAATIAPPP
ncbi:AMP-binding protein, partial [Acidiphilium sp.]|uniref:AMP-binding protein n=1 Tax=Acidiphilium sp. TaxID=527 RepID=UPI003D03751E